MKRDHPHPLPHPQPTFSDCPGGSSSTITDNIYSPGKSKMPWNDCEQDAGVDELLAVLGYKVKSSDMIDVAEKLQHLEEAMGQAHQEGITQLGSDTVHYNPSDLSSWLESMIGELNPPEIGTQSSIIFDDSVSDYDLKAIPGKAVFVNQNQTQTQNQNQPVCKKQKTVALPPVSSPWPVSSVETFWFITASELSKQTNFIASKLIYV